MWVDEASTVNIDHITRFFTNQQYDRESGLYYYNARYYDPHLGSFITPDPAMDGINHYAYANANPIKYSDPTGLACGDENHDSNYWDYSWDFSDNDKSDMDALEIYYESVNNETTEEGYKDSLEIYYENKNKDNGEKNKEEAIRNELEKNTKDPLKKDYVWGESDCDIFVEDTLKKGGKDITNTWGGPARDKNCSQHKEALKKNNLLNDKPGDNLNVVLMDESHVGVIDMLPDDSVDFYHAGRSTGYSKNPHRSRESYDSLEHFEKTWSKEIYGGFNDYQYWDLF